MNISTSGATGKTRVVREVIEREEVEEGDQRLPPFSQGFGKTDRDEININVTVEEFVFGKRFPLQNTSAPGNASCPQRKNELQHNTSRWNSRGSNLDESFRPLASSSFTDPEITSPVALNLSSPLDVSAINSPYPPSSHQTSVFPTRPVPQNQNRRPFQVPFQYRGPPTPAPLASTTFSGYETPRSPVPTAYRTLPNPGEKRTPRRAISQPPAGKQMAASTPPGGYNTFSGFQTPKQPVPKAHKTVSLSGVKFALPPSPETFNSTSREAQLQNKLEDVENQIARVALALQSQGIETELSEESQLRLISFLQKRLQDLEAKVAQINEYSRSDSGTYEDNSGRGYAIEQGGSWNRNLGRRVADPTENADNTNIHILFDLQDVITKTN